MQNRSDALRRAGKSAKCYSSLRWNEATAMATESCDLDAARLREAIQAMYTRVVTEPQGAFHFHRGPEYAVAVLGYSAATLATLPPEVTAAFSGIGNPLRIATLRTGMTVVDVGCGAGLDLLLAARAVGPSGRAIGIEMTEPMAAQARSGASVANLENVEVRSGDAVALPIETESVDVVISNGVLNLVPEKDTAARELYRVLKAGGQLSLADIALDSAVSDEARRDIDLWTA
jgi:arsenite methyltransferase